MEDSNINTWLTILRLRKLLKHIQTNKTKQSFVRIKLSTIRDPSRVSQLRKGSKTARLLQHTLKTTTNLS